MREMTERILRAYFTESRHIGDHETLTELAVEVGLNKLAVEQMLASEEMADAVRTDEETARQYGVTGVPFFLLNKKYALTGAQPTEVFVQALKKIVAEDKITVLNGQDGSVCDDDGCEIPKK
jgi:predicted DsbA family dithiol-disulfide isomerase